jgi:hypothetical protein
MSDNNREGKVEEKATPVLLGSVGPGIVSRFLLKVEKLCSRLPQDDLAELNPVLEGMKKLQWDAVIRMMADQLTNTSHELFKRLDKEEIQPGRSFLDKLMEETIAASDMLKLPVVKTFYKAVQCSMEDEAIDISMYFLWFYRVRNDK